MVVESNDTFLYTKLFCKNQNQTQKQEWAPIMAKVSMCSSFCQPSSQFSNKHELRFAHIQVDLQAYIYI